MVTLIFFIFFIKKTIAFKKKFIFFAFTVFFSTKTFAFNDSQKWEISSQGNESPIGLHCFKKHVLSTNFHGKFKEGLKNILMLKEYGRHEVSSIQVLIYVSVYVVVFLTSIFLF